MVKIIGISGISGAGKTVLVKALGEQLQSTSLYWDDFDDISSAPDDYLEWHNQGKDYKLFDYSELANALKTLKSGATYLHPVNGNNLLPTQYIFADLPLGRMHNQTSEYVDFFIYLDVPLDIALARRIIRDYELCNGNRLLKSIRDYVDKYRKLFIMEDVKLTADMVLDSTLTIEQLVAKVIKVIEEKYK